MVQVVHSTPKPTHLDSTKSVTFILGAGASHPYGFPLGDGLKSTLNGIAANFVASGAEPFPPLLVREFRDAVSGTSHPTIDIFLEKKKKFRDIGAYAIAHAILPQEHSGQLFPQRDWYAVLYRMLRLEEASPARQKVSFVTLNYDRSLEHFLTKNLEYNCDDDLVPQAREALAAIEIIHAHGSLGPYPQLPYSDGAFQEGAFSRAAANIKIISDNLSESADFQRAQATLRETDQIVFIGFGYDSRTLSLLFDGVDVTNKTIFGTGFRLKEERRQLAVSALGDRFTIGDGEVSAEKFLTAIVDWS